MLDTVVIYVNYVDRTVRGYRHANVKVKLPVTVASRAPLTQELTRSRKPLNATTGVAVGVRRADCDMQGCRDLLGPGERRAMPCLDTTFAQDLAHSR